jgi:hypothetical protein
MLSLLREAGGTGLWRRALRICRDRGAGAFPNCTTVRLASWWGPGAAAPPVALLLAAPVPPAPPIALLPPPVTPAPSPGNREGRR